MLEWIAVTGAGAFGGFVATLLADRLSADPQRVRFWPSLIEAWEENKKCRWMLAYLLPTCTHGITALILNMLGGAVGSFLLWATYTSSLTFSSKTFSPAELAAAIIVGLGGISAARGFMHETRRADEWKQTAQATATAFVAQETATDDQQIDGSGSRVHNGDGGAGNG